MNTLNRSSHAFLLRLPLSKISFHPRANDKDVVTDGPGEGESTHNSYSGRHRAADSQRRPAKRPPRGARPKAERRTDFLSRPGREQGARGPRRKQTDLSVRGERPDGTRDTGVATDTQLTCDSRKLNAAASRRARTLRKRAGLYAPHTAPSRRHLAGVGARQSSRLHGSQQNVPMNRLRGETSPPKTSGVHTLDSTPPAPRPCKQASLRVSSPGSQDSIRSLRFQCAPAGTGPGSLSSRAGAPPLPRRRHLPSRAGAGPA